MIPHRFNGKLFTLAFIGIILFFGSSQIASNSKDESMQPELSSPAVSKLQAESAAIAFLHHKFDSLNVSNSLVLYESQKTLSGYLQKHNLTKQYKADFNKRFPLDYWQVQVWDEYSATRYILQVGMAQPNVFGWNIESKQVLRSDQKAPVNVSESKAREIVENFAKLEGYDLANFESGKVNIVDDKVNFEFIQHKAAIGDAKQKLSIGVSSNSVVSYHVSFEVPEADSSWMKKQESYGQIMSLISLSFMLVFAITALVISIRKRKFVSFGRGWLLAGIYLIISFVSAFNTLPSMGVILGEDNAALYLIINMIFTLGINFLISAAIYFAFISGIEMWRERSWNAWPRWKEARFGADVFYGMGRGYLLCIFILGVQQALFLFAGKAFHSFAINDPSQSEYNMLWPALFPTVAWMAAISEEIIFRLFAIIIMQRLLKIRFLAVLIPSIIWALGHTSYSLYPSYTRLFEVTILGIIFSYIFLHYGLITALLTHAIMDSLLMGLSLLSSANNLDYTLMGIFYIFLPLILGYFVKILKHKRRPIDLNVG